MVLPGRWRSMGVETMTEPLEQAYIAHADELIRYATAIVGPDDASDVVVDAMLKVFDRRGAELSNDAGHHLRAYLFRAVYTGSLDHQRSRVRSRRRETTYSRREARSSLDPATSVDAHRALGELSPQQRTIAFLHFWCDHSVAEIAEILGVTDGTVHKQLARARARLKEILDV
jgi:RNA polymerase sigma-70 factor, ECF subfamily